MLYIICTGDFPKIISITKKYWLLNVDFENFSIHSFCVYLNFLGRFYFLVNILKNSFLFVRMIVCNQANHQISH